MPCYCDSPDSEDQIEIQRRCKENMYFDSLYLLTSDQIEKANKMNLKKFPGFTAEEVNENLCKLCSIMTKEQMVEISAYYFNIKWKYKNLLGWYAQHLKDDIEYNEFYIKNIKENEEKNREKTKKLIEEKKEIQDKSIEQNLKLYNEALNNR